MKIFNLSLLILTIFLNKNIKSDELIKNESLDFIVSRIDTHVKYLTDVCLKNEIINNLIFKPGPNISLLLEDPIEFKSELVCLCRDKMKHKNQLEPLVTTWNEFKEYRLRDSNLFIREFTILILIIYKNLLVTILPLTSSRNIISEMLNVFQQSLSLPVGELIYVIEIFYNKINLIVSSVAVENNLNWYQWLKKYWHVPSAILAAIVTLAIKNYITHFEIKNS